MSGYGGEWVIEGGVTHVYITWQRDYLSMRHQLDILMDVSSAQQIEFIVTGIVAINKNEN